MLGLTGHNRLWRWKAVGKHPAAADYINVQGGTPLMEAMADWMTKGYDELLRGCPSPQGYCSWRFWLRGTQKGSLICGLGRDSSDRIGRPFPLLIVGEGHLKGWEKQWPQLPAILTKTWARMERIAAHRYDDLKSLVSDLEQLLPPRVEDAGANVDDEHAAASIGEERLNHCRTELQQIGRTLISLNDSQGMDMDSAVIQWHGHLKTCSPDIPRAVFMGGPAQHAFLAVMRQPLSTADFVRLWSAQ